jgi:hypothetical protein
MDKLQFKKLIRECIEEVLTESSVKTLDSKGNWVDKPDGFTDPTPKPVPGKPPKINVNKQMSDLDKSNKTMKRLGLDGMDEELSPEETENPLYVEYLKPMTNETPFMMNGEKFEYCWAKYPNGKTDIGVYAYHGDMCYGYQAFRQKYNIKEDKVNEMTSTGAVAGFMSKNWCDPDPERKKMKSIAAKSVGGKVS